MDKRKELSNKVKACIYLVEAFFFYLNGRFLLNGYGAAKVLAWINMVLCILFAFLTFGFILLVISEYFLAPKGGATVTIQEDKKEEQNDSGNTYTSK